MPESCRGFGCQRFPYILVEFIEPFILDQTGVRIHNGVGIRPVETGDDLSLLRDLHRELGFVPVPVRVSHAQDIPDFDAREFPLHPVCLPGQLLFIVQVLEGAAAAFAEHRTGGLHPLGAVGQAFQDFADGKGFFSQDHPDPGFFLWQQPGNEYHFPVVPQHAVTLIGEVQTLSGEFFVSFHGPIINLRYPD